MFLLLVLISCIRNSHNLHEPISSGMTTAFKSKRGSRSTGCISATLYQYPASTQSSVWLVCRNITLEHVRIPTSLVWWLQIDELRCVVCECSCHIFRLPRSSCIFGIRKRSLLTAGAKFRGRCGGPIGGILMRNPRNLLERCCGNANCVDVLNGAI